ncbi:DNA gyrase subunit A [Seleniivibrio woodruffii]|uniref:DNA gyrase subunit A n=1 Tax=Seleniivibrio woodruffii TaxID=1078050 RepID=UPI0026EA2330|nr:DNA gyrase subunit A [Seleniivibrio woodruffii]
MEDKKRIVGITVEESVKNSYLDYAMSVIVGRALPDVRDGLKPVHRRVLYSMSEMGVEYNKPYKKSARIVGDVIGKYHPHGDSAVYDTLVRMAQNFSLRYPLVDGQGNFGSVDGDSAAAMRYTEVRLSKIADELLSDLDKDTVDFTPNYDGSLDEPAVLPTRVPTLLINGTSGIAVGMATNIPPHNITEVITALNFMIDNENYTEEDILGIVKGPDFPTYGLIMGKKDILNAYRTGRGSITIRSRVVIEETKSGKPVIIVREIPYQVNKASMIEKIAELVHDKKITGITDLRDESDKDGIRVVIELRKGENADVVLNRLYKFTQMQTSFGFNMVALVDGKPHTLSLMRILQEFIAHRVTVVTRRTKFLLRKAEDRLHILEGLIKAVENIDEVIKTIKSSKDTPEAKRNLCEKFGFSEIQAQSILEMRLQKLTGLEIEKLQEEYHNTLKDIEYYRSILGNRHVMMSVIKTELEEVKAKYGDERRTEITADVQDFEDEDLIPNTEKVVTMTHQGYIKSTLLSAFTSQKRGGKGKTGAGSKDEDFIERIIVTSNHTRLMFFTNTGKVHYLKVYNLPEALKEAKGRHISNLLTLEADEKIASVLPMPTDIENKFLFFATKEGVAKKTSLEEFSSGRSGIVAIKMREGDEIIAADLTTDEDHVIFTTRDGKNIQFSSKDVRPMGRSATGVRGITLEIRDFVVSMEVLTGDPYILSVTAGGYGKLTDRSEYRVQTRGGKGVKLCRVSSKTGFVCGAKQVRPGDEVMLITKSGKTIRIDVSDISTMGRDTMGVKLMDIEEDNEIISFAVVKEGQDNGNSDGREDTGSEGESGAETEG